TRTACSFDQPFSRASRRLKIALVPNRPRPRLASRARSSLTWTDIFRLLQCTEAKRAYWLPSALRAARKFQIAKALQAKNSAAEIKANARPRRASGRLGASANDSRV